MNRSMLLLFGTATLGPALLIALAALFGGWWVLLALLCLTLLTATLDALVAHVTPAASDAEFPVANGLSVILALTHFALLALIVHALTHTSLTLWEKAGLLLAAVQWFGQVSNSNAHELIHRGARGLHRLGMWVYISLLFGHHTSAHVLVHHRHVATAQDPNSARLGENFYHFAVRAWRGSFRAGYRAEAARLHQTGRSAWRNPYVIYLGGAVLMMACAALIDGWRGLFAYILLATLAQTQLLMSDYVQHYGLNRATRDNGKPEPVGDRHSWNSPHWASSALMLNAPRHSDHHAHPARPYTALALPAHGPTLPRSLPVMATLALFPDQWRRVMDPLVKTWTR